MKRIKEIRLENFSDIEKMFDDVKSCAKGKNGEFLTAFDRIKILSDAGLLK